MPPLMTAAANLLPSAEEAMAYQLVLGALVQLQLAPELAEA